MPTNRKRFYSKELNMQFDAYDDGTVITADHITYSPAETSLLHANGEKITLALHQLKSAFNGKVVNDPFIIPDKQIKEGGNE
ncbi:MAG: hypothetical protein PHS93_08115 [Candidatus Omnitrophica bacterium]|nr:hypothetical protein [Candidatus Omnitrophota bacterium]MDD5353107.1 hypothetical protein [Candidatus Omnitrophota bacterium]MDD5551484.1 hypothetical protein [Candidatus Omnitrophota bacterium]